MPEYISRYINLSASRWFPRRIQEVISGTSMRSPVGSLAACARALSREKERERVPEAAGMAVPRINRVQSECVLSVEWQRERRECTRGRKTIRGRRWNKKERERDSRAGCGTRPRGGDSRLVNAIAVERGERREEKVQVSCVEALESRVAFEFFTWLANSSPPLLALAPSQSRDHTLACAGKHPRCISPFNRSRLSFTRFSPPEFRCNFFLSAVLKRVVLSRGCFFIDRSSFRSVDTRWRNKGRLNNGWIGEREREREKDRCEAHLLRQRLWNDYSLLFLCVHRRTRLKLKSTIPFGGGEEVMICRKIKEMDSFSESFLIYGNLKLIETIFDLFKEDKIKALFNSR